MAAALWHQLLTSGALIAFVILTLFICMQLTSNNGHLIAFCLFFLLQLEADALQISPQSPLVSTTLQENGWVCGKLHNS